MFPKVHVTNKSILRLCVKNNSIKVEFRRDMVTALVRDTVDSNNTTRLGRPYCIIVFGGVYGHVWGNSLPPEFMLIYAILDQICMSVEVRLFLVGKFFVKS